MSLSVAVLAVLTTVGGLTMPAPLDAPVVHPVTATSSDGRFADYPADITGKNWKVTLPVFENGKAKEVKPPEYYTFSDPEHFYLNSARDGIIFRAYHGGGTTPNSSNPRSELRERVDDKPEGYWNAASGWHTMTVRGQLNRLTKVKPHTVIAQIHGGDDDITVFRVEGTTLWLTDGDNTHAYMVTDDFKLNEEYRIGFKVRNGTISYTYNGRKLPFTLTTTDDSCYFKAGAYLQSNPKTAPGEVNTEYTEVEMFDIDVRHFPGLPQLPPLPLPLPPLPLLPPLLPS